MAATPQPGTVRLGIAPIAWLNDDLPALGHGITLEQCLKEARQAGYAGIEKGDAFPSDPKILGAMLADHGLVLVSGRFSGRLLDLSLDREKDRLKAQLDLFLALDCPVLIYAEMTDTVRNRVDTPVADRKRLRTDDLRRYGEKLTKLADWLAAEGCPMSYHPHVGTAIETEAEIDLLMASTDVSVGLLFDTGHLVLAGAEAPAVLRRHAARVNHVHAKNVRPKLLEKLHAERWSFRKGVAEGVFTVPGDPEGGVDFREVCRILKEVGYQGWIVVAAEQDPKKANPLEMAQMGHEALTATCREAGLAIA